MRYVFTDTLYEDADTYRFLLESIADLTKGNYILDSRNVFGQISSCHVDNPVTRKDEFEMRDVLPLRIVSTENGHEVFDRLGRMIAVTRYPKLFHALNHVMRKGS